MSTDFLTKQQAWNKIISDSSYEGTDNLYEFASRSWLEQQLSENINLEPLENYGDNEYVIDDDIVKAEVSDVTMTISMRDYYIDNSYDANTVTIQWIVEACRSTGGNYNYETLQEFSSDAATISYDANDNDNILSDSLTQTIQIPAAYYVTSVKLSVSFNSPVTDLDIDYLTQSRLMHIWLYDNDDNDQYEVEDFADIDENGSYVFTAWEVDDIENSPAISSSTSSGNNDAFGQYLGVAIGDLANNQTVSETNVETQYEIVSLSAAYTVVLTSSDDRFSACQYQYAQPTYIDNWQYPYENARDSAEYSVLEKSPEPTLRSDELTGTSDAYIVRGEIVVLIDGSSLVSEAEVNKDATIRIQLRNSSGGYQDFRVEEAYRNSWGDYDFTASGASVPSSGPTGTHVWDAIPHTTTEGFNNSGQETIEEENAIVVGLVNTYAIRIGALTTNTYLDCTLKCRAYSNGEYYGDPVYIRVIWNNGTYINA